MISLLAIVALIGAGADVSKSIPRIFPPGLEPPLEHVLLKLPSVSAGANQAPTSWESQAGGGREPNGDRAHDNAVKSVSIHLARVCHCFQFGVVKRAQSGVFLAISSLSEGVHGLEQSLQVRLHPDESC